MGETLSYRSFGMDSIGAKVVAPFGAVPKGQLIYFFIKNLAKIKKII